MKPAVIQIVKVDNGFMVATNMKTSKVAYTDEELKKIVSNDLPDVIVNYFKQEEKPEEGVEENRILRPTGIVPMKGAT